ncbi:hypothetical protein [Kitasatospora aureofaciens]|uniref:hypothetical protein n=1 Tax=Kitasatospora aureofaciens TaxID=1894 RepID=UPI00340B39F8
MENADAIATQLPAQRTDVTFLDVTEHAWELYDWVERAGSFPGASGEPSGNMYNWLRLTSGVRAIKFNMEYDDGGMCSGGDDFDYMWSEMMDKLHFRLAQLAYARAAFEAAGHLLLPDVPDGDSVLEAVLGVLKQADTSMPYGAATVGESLTAYLAEAPATYRGGVGVPGVGTGGFSAALRAAIALQDRAGRGLLRIPQPLSDYDDLRPTGEIETEAAAEGATVLLMAVQALLGWAVAEGLIGAPNEDKYLLDGMWLPDGNGGGSWVEEEMSYADYLPVLHLVQGEQPADHGVIVD